jgi:hypothetical protein
VVHVDAGQTHPDVHADADAQIPGERPVVRGDFGSHIAWRACREGERQQLIVGLEILLADAPDVLRVRP